MIALFGRVLALALPFAATGCATTLSGVGGSDTFGCKAPPGVACQSVSGVYANAVAKNLPAQRQNNKAPAHDATDRSAGLLHAAAERPALRATPGVGSALRTEPRVLRLWIAPWEDSDGDLHDQSFVYLSVDPGRWTIEHNRAPIRREYAPVRLIEQPARAAEPVAARDPAPPQLAPQLATLPAPEASDGQ